MGPADGEPSSGVNPIQRGGRNMGSEPPAGLGDPSEENDSFRTEQSPLLFPESDGNDRSERNAGAPLLEDNTFHGEIVESSKTSWYLFLLTLSLGGLQVCWSVELSSGSPFLLSLGISKAVLAIVWIAGPLSGTLVQPYVGLRSDRCRISWGRRKPFMIGGAAATIISLLSLAWTRDILGLVVGIFGVEEDSKSIKIAAIVWATAFIYILDFSINTIEAGIRAFMVDCTPTHQQDQTSAWAVRVTGVGNILGYLAGFVDLPSYFSFLGNTQFKDLCALASISIITTLAISCYAIQERDPRLTGKSPEQGTGLSGFVHNIYKAVFRLPSQIMNVCQVQFFAWMGWFPFLFYITTYVGELYVEPQLARNPNMPQEEFDALWEKATRVGTLSLFLFSIVNFGASIVLPFFIAPSLEVLEESAPRPLTPVYHNNLSYADSFSPRYHTTSTRWFSATISGLGILRTRNVTLRQAWFLSHLFFALIMFCTFFIRDHKTATGFVALVGVPWALTQWVPFALIAGEVSKHDAIRRGRDRARNTRDSDLSTRHKPDAADEAGIVLGIHNVAMSAPQVVATLVGSLIFKAIQKGPQETGDESVAWTLRFGGICALVAAWLTRRAGKGNIA